MCHYVNWAWGAYVRFAAYVSCEYMWAGQHIYMRQAAYVSLACICGSMISDFEVVLYNAPDGLSRIRRSNRLLSGDSYIAASLYLTSCIYSSVVMSLFCDIPLSFSCSVDCVQGTTLNSSGVAPVQCSNRRLCLGYDVKLNCCCLGYDS